MESEMTEEIALAEDVNLFKVDLSCYRTNELRVAIEETLSIHGNLIFFMRTLLLVWIIGPIIMALLFSDNTAWITAVWSIYGAISFFFIAMGLGIFFTKRRLLGNIISEQNRVKACIVN